MHEIIRSVLAGICEAIIAKKLKYTPYTNKWQYKVEMFAITSFSELLFTPFRKVVDFEKVPQDLRSQLYTNLDKFGNEIHTMILGSGSGGMVPEAYSDRIMRGENRILWLSNVIHNVILLCQILLCIIIPSIF